MGLFGPSKSELLEMFKTRDDGHVAREFNFRVNDAKKNQRDRYTIDMSVINQFTNLVKDLKMSEINRGIQMQKEQGPQKDWAIAGGIANGLLGGMAGVAVAVGTMQDNIESTIRHHENGRKMVENGIRGIETIDKDMKKVNQIAVNINHTDNFEYTDVLPELINCFEFERVSIIADETTTIYKTKMFGGLEEYNLNKLQAYNSIGFFEAKISIKNNFHLLFPNENEKQIDGAFKIILYDENREIAYGYVSGDNWSLDDLKRVGFKEKFERKVTFKLVDKRIEISPNKNYTAKFSEANLWLVKPIR